MAGFREVCGRVAVRRVVAAATSRIASTCAGASSSRDLRALPRFERRPGSSVTAMDSRCVQGSAFTRSPVPRSARLGISGRALENVHDESRDGGRLHPVAIGRDDVPRRPVRRRLADDSSQAATIRRSAPYLEDRPCGTSSACASSTRSWRRCRCPPSRRGGTLDDRRALVDERPLPLADVRRAGAPDLLGCEGVHPHRDHVLVVRAVEDADRAAWRQRGVDPTGSRARLGLGGTPKEAVRMPSGFAPEKTERMTPSCPTRRDPAGRRARHGALGVEPVLQVGDPLAEVVEHPPRGLLRPEAEIVSCVARSDPVLRAGTTRRLSITARLYSPPASDGQTICRAGAFALCSSAAPISSRGTWLSITDVSFPSSKRSRSVLMSALLNVARKNVARWLPRRALSFDPARWPIGPSKRFALAHDHDDRRASSARAEASTTTRAGDVEDEVVALAASRDVLEPVVDDEVSSERARESRRLACCTPPSHSRPALRDAPRTYRRLPTRR